MINQTLQAFSARVRLLCAVVIIFCGTNASAANKLVSINLCTDQLVLLFAEEEQILSLSNLSHDESGSFLYQQARQYPVSKGETEHVLKMQPDIIFAGEYTTRYTVQLLRDIGYEVVTLPIANTLEQMYENMLKVSALLGHAEKGNALVASLRARVDIQRSLFAGESGTRPTAAFYDANGYTVGRDTLRGEVLALAGWSNVSAKWGITHYGSLPLESMVTLSPQAIIESPYGEGTYSRGQQMLSHPALHANGLDPLLIRVPSRQTICAGPWTVDLIELLVQKRQELHQSQ